MNIKRRLIKLRLAAIGDIIQPKFYGTGIEGTKKVKTTPKKFLDKSATTTLFDKDLITQGNIETNTGKVSELAGVHGENPDEVTSFSRNYEAGGDEEFYGNKAFVYDEEGQHVFPKKNFQWKDKKGNYSNDLAKDRKIIDGIYYSAVSPDTLDEKGNIIIKNKGNKILDRNISTDDTKISGKRREREIFRGDELGTIEFLKRKIRRGDPFETPYFTLENGEITGHEGRHRARALMEEGIQEIPVELTDARDQDTIDNILGQEGSLERLEKEIRPAEKYNTYIKREVRDILSGEKRDVRINARHLRKRLNKMTEDTRAPIFGRYSKQKTALNIRPEGIKTTHKVRMNPEHGQTIADAYDQMEHNPNDPMVKASYDAFKNETLDQFNKLREGGLQITKLKPGQKGYSTAEEMHRDVEENNHLSYFPSESGFGTGEAPDHPLLQGTGIYDEEGKEIVHNDLFRIVHDIQGHNLADRSDFSPEGEHAAYLTHKQQYSPLAQKALFTETAGQTNWGVFNRKSGEANRRKIMEGNFSDLEFAPQKAGLLPDEIINRNWHT